MKLYHFLFLSFARGLINNLRGVATRRLRLSAGFEQYYWESRPKTPTKIETFKNDYYSIFKQLNNNEIITEKILKELLITFPADSRQRKRAYTALRALGKWAKFDLQDWSRLKGKYEADNSRYIPDDQEIIKTIEKIDNVEGKWVYGMMAAYGLRNHEVFHLDLSELPIIRVLNTTKTKEHLVFPLPGDLVSEWDLSNAIIPKINLERSNKRIGEAVTKAFERYQTGFVPYALRDAYAIRGAVLGIDSAIMAKWMGHSLAVHHKDYQKYIDKEAHLKIGENNGKN